MQGKSPRWGQGIYDSGKRLERLVENFLIYAQIELLGFDPQKVGTLQTSVSLSPSEIIVGSARREAAKAQRPNDVTFQLSDTPSAYFA